MKIKIKMYKCVYLNKIHSFAWYLTFTLSLRNQQIRRICQRYVNCVHVKAKVVFHASIRYNNVSQYLKIWSDEAPVCLWRRGLMIWDIFLIMSFTCSVVKRNVKRKRKCLGYLKVTKTMFPCTKYIPLSFHNVVAWSFLGN